MCVDLVQNNNRNCAEFPEGAEAIFRWNNIDFAQSVYLYDFDYQKTK